MPGRSRVLVTGAGGFIGHHLVTYLKARGYWVRGVDIKRPEFSGTDADEFELLDLRRWDNCVKATRGVDEVYALAADMGGMGFISSHHARDPLQQRLDQLPHAGGSAIQRRQALPLHVVGLRLSRVQAARGQRRAAEGR